MRVFFLPEGFTSPPARGIPDGSFAHSKTPTVKWDWNRADDAAAATIPDVYVRDILAKKQQEKAA